MFDYCLKPKFSAKCKSKMKKNKLRVETIKKKRNSMEKYMKNDIAMLLNNGLLYDAYCEAEGLLIEQNRTECYNFIMQFTECISKHVSIMQKKRECPEECKEAIPSLIYAAARFADLPELRELRALFTKKYGNSLEPYLNQEFVVKLKAEPPTKEMKLLLMYDIAQEFSIEWDPKALEQKLFKPPQMEHNDAQHKSLNDKVDERCKLFDTNKSLIDKVDDGYKLLDTKHDTFQKTKNFCADENDTNDNIKKPTRPIGNNTNSTNKSKPRLTRMKRKESFGGVVSMSPTKENCEKEHEKNMHFGNTKPLAYETNEGSRRHNRVPSFQLGILSKHVHPKLPDYDDLIIQLASL
ncbi:hypothetical protein ES332_A09G100600v1 [Gossypium tomentosum]|uniref:Uncharacterized protein n=1 Tax=Gossypium tomentosum TaxID=34277 RepID=A0A5D2P3G3_GOSTO|nr:hypothetical protein ES332_A09G100600v1 [Gossypium tomentosum]